MSTNEKTPVCRIEFDREKDGRWIAEIPEVPGARSYGSKKHGAARKAKRIADTSWSNVARWYDETVEEKGSYQQDCRGIRVALYLSNAQDDEKQKSNSVSGRV